MGLEGGFKIRKVLPALDVFFNDVEDAANESSFGVSLLSESLSEIAGFLEVFREIFVEPDLYPSLWRKSYHVVIDVNGSVMLIDYLVSLQSLMKNIEPFSRRQIVEL
jgi:hypothetical protein